MLSAVFVAFVVLKIAEGSLAVESWPLSHVPMFASRQPPTSLPVRLSLHALRGGAWFEMQPFQLGLNRAELNRHLLRDPEPGAACGELLRGFNASRPRERRVDAAYVRELTLARPATGAADIERRSACPLGTDAR
jgi:hypothetical protein